jgi:hypothetical protein
MGASRFEITELRRIAWAHWDPINLRRADGSPPNGAEDEYDRYMRTLAAMILDGRTDFACTRFLMSIEIGAMGFGCASETRAAETVADVRRYLAQRT